MGKAWRGASRQGRARRVGREGQSRAGRVGARQLMAAQGRIELRKARQGRECMTGQD